MRRLRIWFVAICTWFFLLYNVERLGEPINLATFVYVFAFLAAVLIIMFPRLQKISFAWLFLGSIIPYLFLKIELGYSLRMSLLPIIVTEICAIGLSMVLAANLGRNLEGIKKTLADLTIGHMGEGATPFETGQSRIYREIRRARLFERPATLLAISASEESVEMSMDFYIQEAQREIIKQYIAARISELLVEELQDCDIVAQRNRHFITLLPETTRESAYEIIGRIKEKAAENLKLNLKVGWATFPDEAVTFESLLAIAEEQMTTNQKSVINNGFPGISPEVKAVPSQNASTHPKEAPVQQIS
jgi:hypothetical protein